MSLTENAMGMEATAPAETSKSEQVVCYSCVPMRRAPEKAKHGRLTLTALAGTGIGLLAFIL